MNDEPFLAGSFPVDSDGFQIGPIQIRQDHRRLEVWFSKAKRLPCERWRHETHAGMSVYYSSKQAKPYGDVKGVPIVAGIIYLWKIPPLYPVRQLHVALEDFK
ncbi:MAG: hypothetical protein ACE148_07000 [Vicinamibacterales bacterium]